MFSNHLIGKEISLESLATFPENLIEGNHLKDENYKHIGECKCHFLFDRNRTNDKVPNGYKSTLDFFESISAQYIIKNFDMRSMSKINIVSFGSGKLLRELIILAKVLRELQLIHPSSIPEIELHAVDRIYEKPTGESSYWTRSNGYCVPMEFNKLIRTLNLNINLTTYSSIEEYNNKITDQSINPPHVILSIDFDHAFDFGFPTHQKNLMSEEYTQEYMLKSTKQLAANNSLLLTLTNIEAGDGIFLIFQSKENDVWQRNWIHTISSKTNMDIGPSPIIQGILEKGKQINSNSMLTKLM